MTIPLARSRVRGGNRGSRNAASNACSATSAISDWRAEQRTDAPEEVAAARSAG